MTVQFIPGDQIPCDYGSRHPDPLPDKLTAEEREELGIETEEEDAEIWVRKVLEERLGAITNEEMADATYKDPELGPILEEKQMGIKSTESSKGPYG